MNPVWLMLAAAIGVFGLSVCYAIWKKQLYIWLPAYISQCRRPKPPVGDGPVHIMLCVADHFEPALNRPSYAQECSRVDKWLAEYPAIAAAQRDADGICPQHTFFYPEEEYRPEHINKLAQLCTSGFGDVEIHLHHDHDTAEGLRTKLVRFKTLLREEHGLLHVNEDTGEIEYGFIHGNWALDNAGTNGRWCGVNNEITVLRETGCYADFTLPSAPAHAQTRTINSLYYATDDPLRAKSHDSGTAVERGKPASGDLMIVQGPLALNWRSRKLGLLPRIENGELTADNPPTPARADLWVRQHIHVKGRPDWIFIKLHTHGAEENNARMLLGGGLQRLWSYLEQKYNDGTRYRLHYVTAREMFSIIEAARSGASGNPHRFRHTSGAEQRTPYSKATS